MEKFIGDAVMAVFGAPTAHEDDTERAVRAGLRTLEAIEKLNDEDPALALQVRIGIQARPAPTRDKALRGRVDRPGFGDAAVSSVAPSRPLLSV